VKGAMRNCQKLPRKLYVGCARKLDRSLGKSIFHIKISAYKAHCVGVQSKESSNIKRKAFVWIRLWI